MTRVYFTFNYGVAELRETLLSMEDSLRLRATAIPCQPDCKEHEEHAYDDDGRYFPIDRLPDDVVMLVNSHT